MAVGPLPDAHGAVGSYAAPGASQAERYVNARELAALMGISDRTVKRMVAAGMPSETWGMSRTRRFLPSRALAWARDRTTIRVDNQPGRRSNAAMGFDHPEV